MVVLLVLAPNLLSALLASKGLPWVFSGLLGGFILSLMIWVAFRMLPRSTLTPDQVEALKKAKEHLEHQPK
jgi:hypothetical protein